MSVISPPPPPPPQSRPRRVAGGGVTGDNRLTRRFFAYPFNRGSGPARAETQKQKYEQEISNLSISIDSGTLSVTAGSAGEVGITRQLKWKKAQPNFTEVWDGANLIITSVCPEPSDCEIDYTISVPPGTTVQAQMVDGDVSVVGLSGNLDLSSESGNFSLTRTSGSVRITGDAGEIKGTGLASSAVDVQTQAGDVTLGFMEPPNLVRASVQDAGNVTVTVPRTDGAGAGYNIDANTRAGDRRVEIQQDAASAKAIVLSTVSGDVSIAYR